MAVGLPQLRERYRSAILLLSEPRRSIYTGSHTARQREHGTCTLLPCQFD